MSEHEGAVTVSPASPVVETKPEEHVVDSDREEMVRLGASPWLYAATGTPVNLLLYRPCLGDDHNTAACYTTAHDI